MQSTLRCFTSSIAPFKKRVGDQMDPLDIHLIAIHTFVHCSSIHLDQSTIMINTDSLKNCLLAVDSITAIIQQLTEDDYTHVDAIMSVSLDSPNCECHD